MFPPCVHVQRYAECCTLSAYYQHSARVNHKIDDFGTVSPCLAWIKNGQDQIIKWHLLKLLLQKQGLIWSKSTYFDLTSSLSELTELSRSKPDMNWPKPDYPFHPTPQPSPPKKKKERRIRSKIGRNAQSAIFQSSAACNKQVKNLSELFR